MSLTVIGACGAQVPHAYRSDGWGGVLLIVLVVFPIAGLVSALTAIVLRARLHNLPQRLGRMLEDRIGHP